MLKKLILVALVVLTIQAFTFWGSRKEKAVTGSTSYPVRATYIDRMTTWWGINVAANLGLPGYAQNHDYNHIIFSFWSCSGSNVDVGLVWQNIHQYIDPDHNPWGTTAQEIQQGMKKIYNDNGIKILISAFGATEFPTSQGENATECGLKLGDFVLNNNLDGADIDWEDNDAMDAGTGEQWLIDFTKALRSKIPNHIVTHCPQAPYFKSEYYKNGGYITVNQQVGNLIDFYIIQFYNQGDSQYNTYQELFTSASGSKFNGTSLSEINKRGVPLQKLIVCKPITTGDATNTGWMSGSDLGAAVVKGYNELGWYGGVAHWQYSSDYSGATLKAAAGQLISLCAQSGKCV
jgi:hypothetical protein